MNPNQAMLIATGAALILCGAAALLLIRRLPRKDRYSDEQLFRGRAVPTAAAFLGIVVGLVIIVGQL